MFNCLKRGFEFFGIGKKGDTEISELYKIIIAVVVLVLLVFAFLLLYKGKGGALLDSIKNLLRFGRN